MWAFVPVPLMAVVVAAIVGRNVRAGDGRWASPQLIFLTLAAAVACAVAAASGIDPDVGTSDAVTGVILAAVLGAPPVVAAYSAGWLIRQGWVTGVVLAVAAIPFAVYAFLALIWVMALVYCPPDAYECPV